MYDVCVGISQGQLNQLLASVYASTQGQLFQGNATVNFEGTPVDLAFVIGSPPEVDLSAGFDREAAIASAVEWIEPSRALFAEHYDGGVAKLISHAVYVSDGIAVNLSQIQITFSSGPDKAPMTVSSVTQAGLVSTNGQIGFTVLGTTVTSTGTPFQQWLTKNFIEPKMSEIVAQALGGASFAIPAIPGVSLSPFAASVIGGNIVAGANVNSGLPPAPTGPVPGMGAPFFISLGQNALQAATQSAIGQGKNFSGGDSDGGDCFGVHYNYSFTASNPQVQQPQGNQLVASFQMNGSAGAGATIFGGGIGIGVDVEFIPNPTMSANLVPNGNSVSVVSSSVSPFIVNVSLSGAVGSLLGWMVNWIISGIASGLQPVIVNYLEGITFATLSIPQISVPVGGVTITVNPQLQNVGGEGGMIVLNGALQAS